MQRWMLLGKISTRSEAGMMSWLVEQCSPAVLCWPSDRSENELQELLPSICSLINNVRTSLFHLPACKLVSRAATLSQSIDLDSPSRLPKADLTKPQALGSLHVISLKIAACRSSSRRSKSTSAFIYSTQVSKIAGTSDQPRNLRYLSVCMSHLSPPHHSFHSSRIRTLSP